MNPSATSHLGCPQFTGTLPAWTFPSTLEVLALSDNPSIHGTLPTAWQLPASLLQLFLYNCSLNGPIPAAFKLPPRLTECNLAFNHLTGQLPTDWTLPETLLYLGWVGGWVG